MISLFLWMRRLWGCGQRSCVVHKSTGELAPDCSTTASTQAANSRSRGLRRSAEVGLVGRVYGQLEVVRWRSCRVAARFLHGRVVRAVWVELEHPDRRDRPPEQRLLLCTDPDLPAPDVITAYAKRWAVEPLF